MPFLTDGAVMPSWFDIFEIPVSAVSLLAKYISVLIVIFHRIHKFCVMWRDSD